MPEDKVTAEELLMHLKSNPEYMSKRATKEQQRVERQNKFDEELAPAIKNLNNAGLAGSTLQEIAKLNSPISNNAVAILLGALKTLESDRCKESVIRLLAASKHEFNGESLAACFDNTSDESLKWAIMNTIAFTSPYSIEVWIDEKLKHPYWGKVLLDLGYRKS